MAWAATTNSMAATRAHSRTMSVSRRADSGAIVARSSMPSPLTELTSS
jgi:hypothetical protein